MYNIVIQYAANKKFAPKATLIRQWAEKTLAHEIENAEVTIRIVDVEEMTLLNKRYRHKNGPTNVLSFPFSMPEGIEIDVPILGDIVICTDVVLREAEEQGKSTEAHWTHMVVHGILHLIGYDHENDADAEEMESIEIKILKSFGYNDPYEAGESSKNYD